MISIIQALDLFDDCVSNDDVWRTASNVFKLHGSEWVTLGRTSSRGNSPPLLRTSVPEELMHAYIADNLSNDDPNDLGTAAVDIYLYDADGMVAEHWDVLQGVPTHSANPNGMFLKLFEEE